jgi:hypothetical protein
MPVGKISVTPSVPDGCRDRIVYDFIQLLVLIACVAMFPTFGLASWLLTGMVAHGFHRPVPAMGSWWFLCGAALSWTWMAVGYHAIDHLRLKRKGRRARIGTSPGEFRFDKRLRVRDGSGLISYDDGVWRIDTARSRIQFADADRQDMATTRRGSRVRFSWRIGPEGLRVEGDVDDCDFLPVYRPDANG